MAAEKKIRKITIVVSTMSVCAATCVLILCFPAAGVAKVQSFSTVQIHCQSGIQVCLVVMLTCVMPYVIFIVMPYIGASLYHDTPTRLLFTSFPASVVAVRSHFVSSPLGV